MPTRTQPLTPSSTARSTGELQEIRQHATAADLVHKLRNRAVHNQYRLSIMPGRSAESLEQHATIVDAVVAGDEAAASGPMASHLNSVMEIVGK